MGIPGEDTGKVAYRLLEPEQIQGKKIMVVGGGDSAIESALLLKDQNEVVLSYRKEQFSRLKPKNREKIEKAAADKTIEVLFNSNLVSIHEGSVLIDVGDTKHTELANDLVYIFAGGELPTSFLQNAGVKITRRFGHILKKHK